MSTFKQNLETTKSNLATLLEWRKSPTGLVTIRGVEGTHRVCGIGGHNGLVSCVKQSETAIERAPGAGALPNDRGPSRYYEADRLYPVGSPLWRGE